jgi:hypothetical protein
MVTCSTGHEAHEVSRRSVQETIEDVAYQKERIKHFDREGSEFWAEIDVPIIVEREVVVEIIEFRCDICGEIKVVRKDKGA